MSSRVRLALVCLLAGACLAVGAPAQAGPVAPGQAGQVDSVAPPVLAPPSPTFVPPGFRVSARQAMEIGERVPAIRELRRRHPRMLVDPLIFGGVRWELTYGFGGRVVAEVDISRAGKVIAVFEGPQAQAYLARGHQGKKFDAAWVVLPFALLFLVPFVDLRRPRRLLHLDLLVLLSLGVSYFFFNRGDVITSVPLVYPVLLYVLARMLWIGRRPSAKRGPLVPHLPVTALAVGVVVLAGARVTLNIVNETVIDVGYASVVGADRVWHKQELYTNNEVHGDTYGPVNYLAYVPFERASPWKGRWDSLPAAHAATLAFDLLTIVGLIALGMRLRAGPRGRRLGLALAWGFAAYPWTLFGVMLNTNDGLVALLLVGALLALASAPARGALLALATAAKFIPGALFGLFARGTGEQGGRRPVAAFAIVFGVVAALPVLLYLPDGGLREFYDTTIGFQLGRPSPFSLWGQHPGLGRLQDAVKLAAVGLAVAVAFFPRGRRTPVQVAALAAAVLIAIQLPATHWFYFYVAWFMPLVLVALFGRYDGEPASPAPARVDVDAETPTPRVPVPA